MDKCLVNQEKEIKLYKILFSSLILLFILLFILFITLFFTVGKGRFDSEMLALFIIGLVCLFPILILLAFLIFILQIRLNRYKYEDIYIDTYVNSHSYNLYINNDLVENDMLITFKDVVLNHEYNGNKIKMIVTRSNKVSVYVNDIKLKPYNRKRG